MTLPSPSPHPPFFSYLNLQSRTVTPDPDAMWDGSEYFGTSVLALRRLGASHGYTMVYCESRGVNCFLVDNAMLGEGAGDAAGAAAKPAAAGAGGGEQGASAATHGFGYNAARVPGSYFADELTIAELHRYPNYFGRPQIRYPKDAAGRPWITINE
jgi:hypothetical protein